MSAPGRVQKTIYGMAFVLIAVALCWALDSALTHKPITGDARQNLNAACNLGRWGVFSTERPKAGVVPLADNYREPVVPFAASLLMRFSAAAGSAPLCEDFAGGALCRPVKRVNLFWAFAVLIGSAVLAAQLTRSRLVALLCMVLVYAVFLRNPEHVDTLCTEIATSALMLWTAVVLVMCMRPGARGMLFLCAGVLFGLLCLAKAVFLYLALPAACIVFFCSARVPQVKKRRAFVCTVFFIAGIAAAAGPWMLRNYGQFGRFTLTLRGGTVLYGRALRDTMTIDEVIGALYLWGPGMYKNLVRNTFFERAPADFQEGGRAARLNRSADSGFARRDKRAERAGKPEDAVSFHSRSRAQRTKLAKAYAAQGHPDPRAAADRRLQHEAVGWILEHPVRHTLMTVPFAWRGVWCFYGGGVFTLLNALCYTAFIGLAAWAAAARERRIMVFVLVPFLMLLFNAFLTHNISRYSVPAIPFLVISLFVMMPVLTGRFANSDL